jgi:hypothetical protein
VTFGADLPHALSTPPSDFSAFSLAVPSLSFRAVCVSLLPAYWRRDTEWKTEESGFDSRQGQDTSLHRTQTDTEAHPAVCSVERQGKATGSAHLHLEPYNPVRLHGIVLNYLSTETILPSSCL